MMFDPEDLVRYAERFGYVLAWVGEAGWQTGPAPWTISNRLKAARTNGLVETRARGNEWSPVCDWKLTSLGVAAHRTFKRQYFPEAFWGIKDPQLVDCTICGAGKYDRLAICDSVCEQCAAQGIEAASAGETTKIGSVEDESAVGNAGAPQSSPGGRHG
jgi:hypothetical protein